jgi:hypothetical protein
MTMPDYELNAEEKRLIEDLEEASDMFLLNMTPWQIQQAAIFLARRQKRG